MFPYLRYLTTKTHTFATSEEIDRLHAATGGFRGLLVAAVAAIAALIAMIAIGFDIQLSGSLAVIVFVGWYVASTSLGHLATKKAFDAARQAHHERLGM